MNQIIFFENIDKTKPNFLVKNVYNKSNKMSNWSKISSSNSVDDTVEHKKEWVKLKIKSCGWWIVKRKEIYRENLFGPITIGYIEIFRQKLFNWFSIFQSPHTQWLISIWEAENDSNCRIDSFNLYCVCWYVDSFSVTNLFLGDMFKFTVETIAIIHHQNILRIVLN